MITLSNVDTLGTVVPPRKGLAPFAFPEAKSSQTGVTVEYVPDPAKSWYVFRTTHRREDIAADYLIEDGTYVWIARRYRWVRPRGHRTPVRELQKLMPNIFFAYVTEAQAMRYARDTPRLPFLSFYYNHFRELYDGKNPPLIVPPAEMENFIRITRTNDENIVLPSQDQIRFRSGDPVRVIDGEFEGVQGRVARVLGQQRVVIHLDGIGFVGTAYVPSAFIEKL